MRNGRGDWTLTGGHQMEGEDPYDTLIREVKEEIGIVLKKDKIEHLKTIKRPLGKKGKIAIFKAECSNLEVARPVQIKPDAGFKIPEVMEIRWLTSMNDLNILEFSEKQKYCREFLASQFSGSKLDKIE